MNEGNLSSTIVRPTARSDSFFFLLLLSPFLFSFLLSPSVSLDVLAFNTCYLIMSAVILQQRCTNLFPILVFSINSNDDDVLYYLFLSLLSFFMPPIQQASQRPHTSNTTIVRGAAHLPDDLLGPNRHRHHHHHYHYHPFFTLQTLPPSSSRCLA